MHYIWAVFDNYSLSMYAKATDITLKLQPKIYD